MKRKLLKNLALTFGALLLSATTNFTKAQTCGVGVAPPTTNGCQFGDQIDTFTLNATASPVSPGCSGGAAGYTSTAVPIWTLTAGASNNFTTTCGGTSFNQSFAIWIDLNKNGVYDNTEALFNSNTTYTTTHVGTFTVPLATATGTYNMRIRDSYLTAQTTACGNTTYGEAEDYVINIIGLGAALNFSSTAPYDNVVLPSGINTAVSGLNKITVEAWVKPTVLGGPARTIIGNYSNPSNQAQFFMRATPTNFQCWIGNSTTGGYTNTNSTISPTIGVWQHVAMVWNGAVTTVYVNGVQSGTATVTYPSMGASTNSVIIGGNGIGENFDGGIDEVRIWNRALCQAEIQNNMNGQISTTAPGLIANYHFNQGFDSSPNGTVTTLTDASGNNYNGTLNNFALTGTTSNWVAPGGVSSTSTVTPFVSPTVSIAGANTICSGTSTTFTASGVNTYTWTSGPTTATFAVTPSVTTTYSVVGTATNGCVSNMATQTLSVNTTPTVAVNSGSICSGSSFTINPTGASTYTIQGGSAVVTPTATSSYTVVGTSAAGCVSANTATSSVAVNANPTVTAVSSNSVYLCVGQTATLTAGGASTYTWNTSATTTVIAVSPTVTTSYTVTGTNAAGCKAIAVVSQSVSTCTGINGNTLTQGVNIYPNPTNGSLTVYMTEYSATTVIEVVNLLGETISSQKVTDEKTSLNLGQLVNGVYFVRIENGNSSKVYKIVKE